MKILITGGKSAVALKLLKAFKDDEVVLADYDDVPSFASKDYKFISLGIKNEETLSHTLLNYCLDEYVEAILPIQHFEIEPVAKTAVLYGEFNIKLFLPDFNVLNQYLNQLKSKEWAVFENGKTIFSTITSSVIEQEAKQRSLNGAYYINADMDKLTFNLITI